MSKEYNLSDSEIIKEVLSGNIDAFEILIKRYKTYVFEIVSRHAPYNEVEELSHEVFICAYKALPKFKNNFKSWIYKIAVRKCYEFWRKRYKKREILISELTKEHKKWLKKKINDESNQSFWERRDLEKAREILDFLMQKLSPEEKIVLELIYFEEKPIREVAKILGWGISKVKVKNFRSKKKLRKMLSEIIGE